MDFNRTQQVLEMLQAQCPNTDTRHTEVWISAITRAREALLELQVVEDQVTTPIRPGTERGISARPASAK
jgi:hypothetical protein